ncbi:hypothetical protein [Ilyobacter polytropus]|uniref:Uncharacterized protein n=1 Tax=Ilyobacter polytropus (strain ATCC 51220 / DSM 2926 / LMG 16218 / CuHBu1) TaxID=572544 RepID=E3HDV5_ILYPC|nr:hypothetical protein [Ilyobacter polytropus]ADO84567.1 hypothetical protein Ilyop_2813 [Ilyobacter polytropus DSM 2926]
MSKKSFFRVKNLKEAFINSLKIFLLFFILIFSMMAPLYLIYIENFDTISLFKISLITGLRSVFLYLVVISAIRIFKGKPGKINVEKL